MNNRRTLAFHSVHGEHLSLWKHGRLAKRNETFCNSVAFSDRPVAVGEIIAIKLVETVSSWSGVLRFGVSNTDPLTFKSDVPRYVCPDLTSKEGSWAKAINEKYCHQGNILHFYVRPNGEMYYGVNGLQKGLFLSGIVCSRPIWTILDIYGNSLAVEFVDPSEMPLLKQQRLVHDNVPLNSNPPPQRNIARSISPVPCTTLTTAMGDGAQIIDQQRRALFAAQLSKEINERNRNRTSTFPLKYNAGLTIKSAEWHEICGKNVRFDNDKQVATRSMNTFTNGYVFLKHPLSLNEKVIIQIVGVLSHYTGALAFGLTSCNPTQLNSSVLPDDSDNLLDRPEYWIVDKNLGVQLNICDELSFYVDAQGQVYFQHNNKTPVLKVHADQTQELWIFFDLFGSTQTIRMIGLASVQESSGNNRSTTTNHTGQIASISTCQIVPNPVRPIISCPSTIAAPLPLLPPPPIPRNLLPRQSYFPPIHSQPDSQQIHRPQTLQHRFHRPILSAVPRNHITAPPKFSIQRFIGGAFRNDLSNSNDPIRRPSVLVHPGSSCNDFRHNNNNNNNNNNNGITIASDNQTCDRSVAMVERRPPPPPPPAPPAAYADPPVSSGSFSNSSSSLFNVGHSTRLTVDLPPQSSLSASPNLSNCITANNAERSSIDNNNDTQESNECVVCFTINADSVLYTCGHLCMCYSCAKTTWERQGICPICRKEIRDVIKLYRS